MILGVGCDIIRVARVARAAEKEHFLTRVYTPAERAYAMQRGAGCAASLAARFAGKGAVRASLAAAQRGRQRCRGDAFCAGLFQHGRKRLQDLLAPLPGFGAFARRRRGGSGGGFVGNDISARSG